MKLILAPMEGVMDAAMREIITDQNHAIYGGYDQAVTEFIRVTDQLLPETTFYKYCPELRHNSHTSAGTPVFVQLLGGDADKLSENAKKACDLGAIGIDLNFGCPAPTVNRHDGGATLLKSPERILKIIQQVRAAVPLSIPVTAKIRLGFENHDDCLQNVVRIQEAGASWLTVHCRTKKEMYQPIIHWDYIPKIAQLIAIPIVVNGEMWSMSDIQKCQHQTKQNIFMIGRGSMANPFLAAEVKMTLAGDKPEIQPWLVRYVNLLNKFTAKSLDQRGNKCTVKKLKQWIRMTAIKRPDIQVLFDQIKIHEETSEILRLTNQFLDSYFNHQKEPCYARNHQSHHENSLSLL